MLLRPGIIHSKSSCQISDWHILSLNHELYTICLDMKWQCCCHFWLGWHDSNIHCLIISDINDLLWHAITWLFVLLLCFYTGSSTVITSAAPYLVNLGISQTWSVWICIWTTSLVQYRIHWGTYWSCGSCKIPPLTFPTIRCAIKPVRVGILWLHILNLLSYCWLLSICVNQADLLWLLRFH